MDLMKLIMAIVVIAIHTEPLVRCEKIAVLNLYKAISDVAVPFFFLASGFLVFDKVIVLPKEEQERIILNYAKKILKLYLIWTVIYLPITIYDYVTNGESLIRNIFAFFKGLIFVGCHWNSWPLWYLLSVFYAFVLVRLIVYKKGLSQKVLTILAVGVYLIANEFTIILNNGYELNGFGQQLIKVVSAVFVNGRIFTGFFYIVVGFLMAQYKQLLFRRKSSEFLFFIAISICGKIATEGLLERCFLAMLAVSVFCFILISKVPDCKYWHTCRNLSTKIYLLHMIVYSFLDIVILDDRYANGLMCFVITIIGTIILSFGLIYFEKKSKVIEKLF
ncbi:acyltransferase family protein [Coprococcus comes]|uniref:acyltransferase family protein n=1 Tax=Coprococcus comes TaxID=410072 RepID=UPI002ED07E40